MDCLQVCGELCGSSLNGLESNTGYGYVTPIANQIGIHPNSSSSKPIISPKACWPLATGWPA
jgi:hypothetical protein